MDRRRLRVWAIVLAAVLGIAAGVSVAWVAPGSDPGTNPSAGEDPLHLGVPLANLECTGESIMVLGYGAGRAPLDAAIADNPGRDVSYLRTADSCHTLYSPPETVTPEYVAYLGPFDDLGEPCAERMTDAHKGDNVTRLNSGNLIYVKCACVLETATFPVLRVGTSITAESGIWIRALQGLLADSDAAAIPPGPFTEDDITGVYDLRTATRIRTIQAASSVRQGPVTPVTWRILRKRACGTYTY